MEILRPAKLDRLRTDANLRAKYLSPIFGPELTENLALMLEYLTKLNDEGSVNNLSEYMDEDFVLAGGLSIALPLIVFANGDSPSRDFVLTRQATKSQQYEEALYFSMGSQGLVLKEDDGSFQSVHPDLEFVNGPRESFRCFNSLEGGESPYFKELCRSEGPRSVKDTEIAVHSCTLCSVFFASKEECLQHLAKTCHDCMADIGSSRDLIHHILDFHVSLDKDSDLFLCPYCERACGHPLTLSRHVMHFHSEMMGEAKPGDLPMLSDEPTVQCPRCKHLKKGLESLVPDQCKEDIVTASNYTPSTSVLKWIESRSPLSAKLVTGSSGQVHVCFACKHCPRFPTAKLLHYHLSSVHKAVLFKKDNRNSFSIPFNSKAKIEAEERRLQRVEEEKERRRREEEEMRIRQEELERKIGQELLARQEETRRKQEELARKRAEEVVRLHNEAVAKDLMRRRAEEAARQEAEERRRRENQLILERMEREQAAAEQAASHQLRLAKQQEQLAIRREMEEEQERRRAEEKRKKAAAETEDRKYLEQFGISKSKIKVPKIINPSESECGYLFRFLYPTDASAIIEPQKSLID